MGCFYSTECDKCGCPSTYYKGQYPSNSCHMHIFSRDICTDCGKEFGSYSGNCYHKWQNKYW